MTGLDALSIRVSMDDLVVEGAKLEIKAEGQNIAVPPAQHNSPGCEKRHQYFFLPSFGFFTDEEWMDGIAVKAEPRLVRQFVVANDGAG